MKEGHIKFKQALSHMLVKKLPKSFTLEMVRNLENNIMNIVHESYGQDSELHSFDITSKDNNFEYKTFLKDKTREFTGRISTFILYSCYYGWCRDNKTLPVNKSIFDKIIEGLGYKKKSDEFPFTEFFHGLTIYEENSILEGINAFISENYYYKKGHEISMNSVHNNYIKYTKPPSNRKQLLLDQFNTYLQDLGLVRSKETSNWKHMCQVKEPIGRLMNPIY